MKAVPYSDNSGHLIFCPACECAHKFDAKRWSFNGDTEKPTFSPSMLVRGSLRAGILSDDSDSLYGTCHSFVRDGKIEFLSDCTHAMAGQTVDLPDV